MRHQAGEQRWHEYVASAAVVLRERFGDAVRVINNAWVATAIRM
jgi:hypothetical protein